MNKEDLRLPVNIFQGTDSESKFFLTVFVIILISLTLALQSLYFLAALCVTLALMIFLFAKFIKNEDKFDLPKDGVNMFFIDFEFNWDDRIDLNESKMQNLISLFRDNEIDLKFISTFTNEMGNKDIKPFLWTRERHEESNYVYPRKAHHAIIIKRKDTDRIIRIFNTGGIKLLPASPDDYSGWLRDFGLTGVRGMDFRNRYFRFNGYFCLIYLKNSSGDKSFQISDLLFELDFDILLRFNIRDLEKSEFNEYRRHMSTILASSRMKKTRGKSVSQFDEYRLKIAKKYYAKERKDFALFNSGIIVRGDNPLDLNNNLRNVVNKAKFLGLDFYIVNRRKEIRKFVYTGNMTMKYALSKASVAPLIPFMSKSSMDDGIPIGFEPSGHHPVVLDIFQGTSNNILILGETGSGKSYFANLLLSRLIHFDSIEKAYICDPLNDFARFGRNDEMIQITVDQRPPEESDMNAVKAFLTCDLKRKIIIIDEAHKFLSHIETRDVILDMVRTSRHYSTSIVLITQDISDFLNKPYDSIFNNSNYMFIFRNKLWDQLAEIGIKPEDYGYNHNQPLMGGKNTHFSEMYLYTRGALKKIMVMDSGNSIDL